LTRGCITVGTPSPSRNSAQPYKLDTKIAAKKLTMMQDRSPRPSQGQPAPQESGPAKRNRIEAAFQRLVIRDGMEQQLRHAVDLLTRIAEAGPQPIPNCFRDIGRAGTRKELESLANRADALERAISDLHQPAIGALAESGFVARQSILDFLRSLALAARGPRALAYLENEVPIKPKSTKPPDMLANGVGAILANDYFVLTGKKPTRRTKTYGEDSGGAYGPFFDLVKDVFLVIGIEADPDRVHREAITTFKKRDRATE
jgi:hypothetical protein